MSLKIKALVYFDNLTNFLEVSDKISENTLMIIFMSFVLLTKTLNGRYLIRLRRTYKDFKNLGIYISKDLRIKADGIEELGPEGTTTPAEIQKLILNVLHNPDLNTKLNSVHKFFEISMLNFTGF